jgi:phospholipid/cholesterol/gamma-HCH transport system substrate-binding protein
MMALLRRRGTLLANVAVLLVLALGLYHVAFDVLRLQVGKRPYTVHLQLPSSGGLYPRSEVAYRGKIVGRVTDVQLAPGGVLADLSIDRGTKIPVDLDAAVAELSPAGEQFVDLRPRTANPPFLAPGSVIPVARTSVPVSVAVVVHDAARLLDQVGTEDLRTVIDELADAFVGTGPQLAKLVANSDKLLAAMAQDLPTAINLLKNGKTDLDTANELSGQFDQFNASLRTLTKALKQASPTVTKAFDNGPTGIGNLNDFITTLSTPVSALLGNLVTPGSLIAARLPALNALLIAFPQATAALKVTAQGGNFRTELHLTGNPTCSYGGPRRTPIDPTRVPPDLNRYCKDTTTPGVGARGAQNAPRSEPSGPGGSPPVRDEVPVAVGGYDPALRRVVLPDGTRLNLEPLRGIGSAASVIALLLAMLQS